MLTVTIGWKRRSWSTWRIGEASPARITKLRLDRRFPDRSQETPQELRRGGWNLRLHEGLYEGRFVRVKMQFARIEFMRTTRIESLPFCHKRLMTSVKIISNSSPSLAHPPLLASSADQVARRSLSRPFRKGKFTEVQTRSQSLRTRTVRRQSQRSPQNSVG